MSRIRAIKPQFFRHEDLFDLEVRTGLPLRLAFIGLWTVCDREGRFAWRPRSLKVEVLPFDDVDFAAVLAALEQGGFIRRYQAGDQLLGWVPSFARHQIVNQKEPRSVLPPPPDAVPDGAEGGNAGHPHAGEGAETDAGAARSPPHSASTVPAQVWHRSGTVPALLGREGKGKEAAAVRASADAGADPGLAQGRDGAGTAEPPAAWFDACLAAAGVAWPLGAPDIVEAWRAEGFDLARVLAVLRARRPADGQPVRSWKYFDAAVRQALREQVAEVDGLDAAAAMLARLDATDAKARARG